MILMPDLRPGPLLLPAAVLLLVLASGSLYARETFQWKEMPDLERSLEQQSDESIFPDLQYGSLLFTEFTETDSGVDGRLGYLTVRTGRVLAIAVFYYSPEGSSALLRSPLQIEPNQQLSLSLRLPPASDSGILYLAAWEQMPEDVQLELIARHPYGDGGPIHGILATATFGRSASTTGRKPWEDEFRLASFLPPVHLAAGIPELVVRVDARGVICSKDCIVAFEGSVEAGYDDWGGIGRLMLSNPEEIGLEFELGRNQRFNRATLLVFGPATTSYGGSQNSLEAVINNWLLIDQAPVAGPRSGLKHFRFDVGHYLKGGYNLIELRQPATAGPYWPVERSELWLE